MPSSTISAIKVSLVTPTSTETRLACEYFAAFVRLSDTT